MVKPGAVVVAAGVRYEGRKLLSDVADEVAEVAGWLSPRIGGVGPDDPRHAAANTVEAAERGGLTRYGPADGLVIGPVGYRVVARPFRP